MGQVALADAIGTDQGTVSKWENGKQRPSFEDVSAIEDACGRRRGWIYIHAGLVEDVTSIEDAIAVDKRLSDAQRAAVAGALLGVLSQQS